MMTPAIVVIAYNRPDALKRLLTSIEKASYPDGVSAELVISIDKSDTDDVVNVAEGFEYTHGKKRIIARGERMGLREHVLACGDLTGEYGSIIVLEDDLVVAPAFYDYACKALNFADSDDRIGSVSLYNHLFNVHKREAFCAIDDGYDNWYFQMTSSWGQAYTKRQWQTFRRWYADNRDKDLADPAVPANVSGWSEKSWLKYYIVYLIKTGRFCMYPRISYTTNFGDVGTHACKFDTDLQVPLNGSRRNLYCEFSTPDQSASIYDAFFEPVGILIEGQVVLGRLHPEKEGERTRGLIVDLYGYKPVEEIVALSRNGEKDGGIRYVLTSARLPYRVIKSFGRQMRPIDANIAYNVEGEDIFLYDTAKKADPPKAESKAAKYLYEYRGISAAKMVEILKYRVKEKIGKS